MNKEVKLNELLQYINTVNELQLLQSLVIIILKLITWIDYFTSDIFSSYTDIDLSLIFFVNCNC